VVQPKSDHVRSSSRKHGLGRQDARRGLDDVRALDSMQDLEALATPGRICCAATSRHRVRSWELAWHWWQHYGQGQPLRLFVVEHSGSVMGILPLYEQRVRLFPRRWDSGTPADRHGWRYPADYLGPLLDRLARCRCDRAGEHLLKARRDWRVILISDLVEDSPFRRAMLAAATRNPPRCPTHLGRPIVVHLPQSWDEPPRRVQLAPPFHDPLCQAQGGVQIRHTLFRCDRSGTDRPVVRRAGAAAPNALTAKGESTCSGRSSPRFPSRRVYALRPSR